MEIRLCGGYRLKRCRLRGMGDNFQEKEMDVNKLPPFRQAEIPRSYEQTSRAPFSFFQHTLLPKNTSLFFEKEPI